MNAAIIAAQVSSFDRMRPVIDAAVILVVSVCAVLLRIMTQIL